MNTFLNNPRLVNKKQKKMDSIFIFWFIFWMASFNKNEKIGEERLIRLSRRWLITQRKMFGEMKEEACFYVRKVRSTLLSDETGWRAFIATRKLIGKFFVEMDFRWTGGVMAPIEGSNRDLISADASKDYIEKLV